MNDTPERDRSLLGLVERLMRKPGEPEPAKVTIDIAPDVKSGLDPVLIEAIPQASLEPQVTVEATRILSHAELADVVLRALRAIEGCPQQGFEVIVYGSRPWNAMLRITPSAGRLPDADAWRVRVQNMIPLLRAQYELRE